MTSAPEGREARPMRYRLGRTRIERFYTSYRYPKE
jgi:hypothetical protein